MMLSPHMHPTAPFPSLPARLEAAHAAHGLRLRRFGVAYEDLMVDCGRPVGPHLITALLACCTERPAGQALEPQFFWDLGVGKRIECLLILASLEGTKELSIPLRCPQPSCGQPIEIDLTLEEILAVGQETGDDTLSVQFGEVCLVVRRPTGADQLAWLQHIVQDERAAVQTILRTLIVEGPEMEHTQTCIGQIEATLDRHDPLVQFSLSVVCPYCRELAPHEVDLAAFAVQKLRAAQGLLIEEVHRLAAHYHWTEAEILAIPAWRRAHYLALVEREEMR